MALVDRTLLVTGSRSITDQAWVWAQLDAVVARHGQPQRLIHGGARGVDTLAGAWAKARDMDVKVVRPDFTKWPIATFKWKAYLVRDYAMVDEADWCVALWDGLSGGTRTTKDYAQQQGKLLAIIKK